MVGPSVTGMPDDHRKLSPSWGWIWVGAIFILALRPVEDFDTFWQLQSGRYIWQTKSFIYTDLFSLAKDVFRLEHCWLSDLIFYALHALGGYPLLGLLKPLIIALCAGLLWHWNEQRGIRTAIALPALALCLLASAPSWLVRPQLWTFVLALLYLHLLYRGREDGFRSWRWLAPLMLLWANLHAACVFGFALIGFFGVGEVVRILRKQASWGQFGWLTLAGLLTLLASFVNPYGYQIPQILLGFVKLHDIDLPSMAGNMEWLPPTVAEVPLFYVVMVLWGMLILLRWRRLDPAEPVFFCAFLYMGLSMVRHTTLVSLLAGFFLPGALQQALAMLPTRADLCEKLSPAIRYGTLMVLIMLIGTHTVRGELGVGLRADQFPVRATDFVADRQLPPNLFNAYDWGGYLMWRLYPDYLVFVDGRQDSMEHFLASDVIDNAADGWEALLDKYYVNTLLLRTCYYDTGEPMNLVSALSRSPAWALVYRDDVALVYVRRTAIDPKKPLVEIPSREAFRTMFAEASRLYRDSSTRSMALLSMGRAAFQLGETGKAIDYYGRYLEIDPENREARMAVQLLRKP